MSLLMDAINKAEEERGEIRSEEEFSLSPQESTAPPPRPDDREAASKLFAVKPAVSGRYRYWIAPLAVLLLGGVAAYYWYRMPEAPKPVEQSALAPMPLPQSQPAPVQVSDAVAVSSPPGKAESAGKAEKAEKTESPVNAVKIQKSPAKAVVNPLSVQGYQAMNSRDLTGAQRDYGRLLSKDPQNREALIGLAAIALQRGRSALAERYYRRVLEIDPEDPVATANLVNLKNPADGESRLKMLIRNSPDSGALYFSLGNQYAEQSLWNDAQQAYFSAYTKEPENPDYAFNLAVSLDHLNQEKLALDYYKRALDLSKKGFPGFDPSAVELRIRELEE